MSTITLKGFSSDTKLDGAVTEVECLGCTRKVACAVMTDGTIYRPFTWLFCYEPQPRLGWCPQCLDAARDPCSKSGDKHDAERAGQGCLGCDAHDGKAVHR